MLNRVAQMLTAAHRDL